MKKALGLCGAFVGTVIGAGFATGREITLFFSDYSVVSVILSGIFLGAFCYIILRLSSSFGNVFSSFGFLEKALRAFAFAANFCVLCATIAGSDVVIENLFCISGGAIITALLCLSVVLFGVKGVKTLNLFVVPVILVLVFLVFFKDSHFRFGGKIGISNSFAYASMNLITGGFFIGATGDAPTKKESAICAVLSGVILTAMLICVYSVTKNVSAEMPFIDRADALGLGTVGNVVLYLAMITTVIGTLSVCSGNNKIAAVVVTILALIASTFGFGSIVDYFYPIIGALGGAVVVCAGIIWLLNPRFSRYYNLIFRPNGFLSPRRLQREGSIRKVFRLPESLLSRRADRRNRQEG